MVYSQNITPTHVDVRWDYDQHCRVDILQHAMRAPEGNPVVVIRFAGEGMNSDKRSPWVAGGTFNVLANFLNQQTGIGIDVWSVSTPQSHWQNPVAAAHLTTTFDDGLTRPVLFPENVGALKTFYQWANRHAQGREIVPEIGDTLGHTAGDYIAVGEEFGALLQAIACFSGPRPPATTNGQIQPGGRFGPYGTSSGIKGLMLLNPIVDVRAIAGVEQIYWAAMRGLFGTYAVQTEWTRVPSWQKRSASMLAYVQAGETRHFVPQYLVAELRGNHFQPYGDPLTGASYDVRDNYQSRAYVAAMLSSAPVLPHTAREITIGDWETELVGAALSANALAWMRGPTVLNR